jgi:hypothetical protein
MPEPGWYPDPHDPHASLRWWDGQNWTEHLHHSDASSDDDTHRGGDDLQLGNLPSSDAPWDLTGMLAASSPRGDVNAPQRPSTASLRPHTSSIVSWMLVAVIVAIAVAAGLIALGATLSEGRATIDNLSPGHQQTYRVTRNGAWEVEFFAPEGRLVIDVRGHADFDPMAGLVAIDSNQEIYFNDDRGDDGASRFGGHPLDALIEVNIDAGHYRLVVSGWNGQAGDGRVIFVDVGG